ncbi:DUF4278 domain-containing protein [Nostocaceae cyanobacterium CENA357]|uniref:DUF4278 domain-containing protein n=1 Tax=Atlanticothrix silvestris CENA357 TaxID=1725252 RepID=A0A8J7L4T4_9CYAN|nr:DUF4278 domain-containing protein [Atlanticothrix silvestris]MBH8555339.1 DUF4278 domain-containing protein [Atlanticothrix silvestris CENA357]
MKKNNDEISHLVAVFASLSLILGIFLAPWQILFLLLIPILLSTSYEYYTNKLVSKKIEYPQQPVQKFEPNSNLIYRGVSYCSDSKSHLSGVTTAPVTYKLSFRGSSYFICVDPNAQSSGVTTAPVTHKLSFRGSTYSVNRTVQREIKEQNS